MAGRWQSSSITCRCRTTWSSWSRTCGRRRSPAAPASRSGPGPEPAAVTAGRPRRPGWPNGRGESDGDLRRDRWNRCFGRAGPGAGQAAAGAGPRLPPRDPPLRRPRPPHPRRHHRLAGRGLFAGAPQVRARLRRVERLEPGQGAVRRPAGGLRHPRDLGHRHADRRAGELRDRNLHHRAVPGLAEAAARHRDRAAGRHPVDHLRHLGPVLLRPAHAGDGAAGADRHGRRRALDRRPVSGPALRHRHAHGRHHPGRDDPAVHHLDHARRVRDRAADAARVGLRPGCDHLGGGVEGRAAVQPGRRRRRRHAGAGARARRDDGGDLRHRQRPPHQHLDPGAGDDDLGLDRERVHRGGRRHLHLLAGHPRPDPVRHHLRRAGARPADAGPHECACGRPEVTAATARANALYRRRRAANLLALTLSVGAAIFGLLWLLWILATLFWNGALAITPSLFTEPTPPPGSAGGLANAIYGSVVMTVLGTLIGAPVGIMAGTYLSEYARTGPLGSAIRFINDILLSAPSIVIGLFVYELMVVPIGHFSAWAGSVALAILVVPVVVRTTEDMLNLVPNGLREAAAALGAPRWKVITAISYRAARNGMITGILLAVARIAGETAPLLFTALNNQFWSFNMGAPMANLPVTIFQYALSPYDDWQRLAWGGSLLITVTILLLNIVARTLAAVTSNKGSYGWPPAARRGRGASREAPRPAARPRRSASATSTSTTATSTR